MYPDYLIHFNPNHDPKTGQFTFSKYLTRDGRLSDYTKKTYGISKLNDSPSVRNVGYKKAQKMINKDLKQLYKSGFRYLESDIREDYAEAKLEYDIEKANKNKSLINDLKDGVKKYFDIQKDDWTKAIDYQYDELIPELTKKYPEYAALISGITIGETVHPGNVNKWLESNKCFPDILNNDFYYEPMDVGDEYVDQVIKAVNTELTNSLINKYGESNIPQNWLKYRD